MDLIEFTENLIKSIVKEPDMVKVQQFEGDEGKIILEIIVSGDDMGMVIGKGGKMAGAIRTIVQAHAYIKEIGRVQINIDSF